MSRTLSTRYLVSSVPAHQGRRGPRSLSCQGPRHLLPQSQLQSLGANRQDSATRLEKGWTLTGNAGYAGMDPIHRLSRQIERDAGQVADCVLVEQPENLALSSPWDDTGSLDEWRAVPTEFRIAASSRGRASEESSLRTQHL